MQHVDDEVKVTKVEKRGRVSRFLGRAFITMIVLTFSLVTVIHIPLVQRWGIKKLTSAMSTTLNTRVEIGGFSLHPVSDLTIKNIFIASPEYPSDTMIYAVKLHVDYRRIWDLFTRRITISQIGVEQGILNIHRFAGDSLNNLDLTLLRMLPPKDPTKSDFVLDLKSLTSQSLNVRIDDETFGTYMDFKLKRADIALDTLDIIGKFVDIADLDLDDPQILIVNRLPMADSSTATPGSDKVWSLDIDVFRLFNGQFELDNKATPKSFYPHAKGIDYGHMTLTDVDIVMDSLLIRGWDFRAININMHLLHQNGFEFNTISADRAAVSKDGVRIESFKIKTPQSEINNSISLTYSGYTDFRSFVDSVKLDLPSANIRLHTSDLLAIAPGLHHMGFFNQNIDQSIFLEGQISGHVNRLRIKNMHTGIGGLSMTGEFKSRDLAVPGAQLISLQLKKSSFSALKLNRIFPKMKLPLFLNKLGEINFVGDFDGYPDDFVAFGNFHTSLGTVSLDMNLNIVQGLVDGKYSGSIGLKDFNLGGLTENPDLGKVTMTGRVIEGVGLNAETFYADVTAKMTSLAYKGYTYRNARVDGQMLGKMFIGTFDINDPNVDLHFEGTVDSRDSVPKLDFIARIDSIQFWELGLSKKDFALKGIFEGDMAVGGPDQFEGLLFGEKIQLKLAEEVYGLDSLTLASGRDTLSGDKVITIASDVVTATFVGEFDPMSLPNQVQSYLHTKYPRSIGLPTKSITKSPTQRLQWQVLIHDSEHWFDLVGMEGLIVRNARTTGNLDIQEEMSLGIVELPELHYNDINVYWTSFTFMEDKGRTEIDLELTAADLKENFFLEDVLVSGTITNDSVMFNVKTDQLADVIDELDLDVKASPKAGNWNISFQPQKLVMLGDHWNVPTGNKVEIRKGEFEIEKFELFSKDQKIILDDINNKGLEAYVSGFDISYLNELWINDKFDFSGLYTLDFEIDNLYDIRQMEAVLSLSDLRVNNVPYGQLVLNAAMNDPKDSVRINLVLQKDESSLVAKGAYLPPIKSIPKDEQNYLRLGITAKEFPLDFIEFLIGENIRDTEGSVDVTLDLSGKANALNPVGKGMIYNGSTVIDYLGAAYSFHEQTFRITETTIDLSGIKLYDVLGNTATVQGGLTHRYLRNLGLNATLTSDKILGLDVTSEENNIFYGKGIGSVFARFTGTVANPKMVIDMATARGTHIYIPLTSASTDTDRDFVIFLQNGVLPIVPATLINISGIDLTMNMTITEDAVVELIFDDNTGEVLRGTGTGDMTLTMNRLGNFSMYGNYKIAKGDYLFTNFRVVRKPFELRDGGEIVWDGDPYNANINVQAKYKDLQASVYTLIQEYITDPSGAQRELYDQSRERTGVDLIMTLSGSLLQPDISFDIQFPELSGELKGYVNTKVNLLKANENAMLQQVVGLLITRSFLPTTTGTGSGLLLSQGIDNTLSELISSTLSSYLGGLLGDLIPTGTVLSGVDFQMNLDLPISQAGATADPTNPLEDPYATVVEVNLPLEFFNDRLEVKVGGDYTYGATTVAVSEYWAGDVTFGYKLTPDGRLKIRAFNQNTLTVEGRKNKVGVGLSYRREYNSLSEFFGKKEKPN